MKFLATAKYYGRKSDEHPADTPRVVNNVCRKASLQVHAKLERTYKENQNQTKEQVASRIPTADLVDNNILERITEVLSKLSAFLKLLDTISGVGRATGHFDVAETSNQ